MKNFQTSRDAAISAYRKRDFVNAARHADLHFAASGPDADLVYLAANAYFQMGQIDKSAALFEKLRSLTSDVRALTGLALISFAEGREDDAETILVDALSEFPTSAEAWGLIRSVRTFAKGDPLVAKAKQLLSAKDTDDYLRRELNYTLSKAMNDIEHWDRAWAYAVDGSKSLSLNYNPDRLTNAVMAQERFVTPDLMERHATSGFAGMSPIFIVGMPRSGTTLVEKILQAHPNVTSIGESLLMPQLVNDMSNRLLRRQKRQMSAHEWMEFADKDDFRQIGESYFAEVQKDHPGGRRYVDKMPGNVLMCAAIRLALPNAKFIWVRRDPLDTCVSCFMSRFGSGNEYSYDLEWLGRCFRDYERSGSHYAGLLDESMMTVDYETLVSDNSSEIKRILGFVGLDWHEDCLRPDQVNVRSYTMSTEQVKQPINNRAVGRWQRYRRRLKPLIQALDMEDRYAC